MPLAALSIVLYLVPLPGHADLVYSVQPISPEPPVATPAREVTAVALPAPVTLDGVLDEPAWDAGLWLDDWLLVEGAGRGPAAQTRLKVRFDGEALYLGVIADEPNMAGLQESAGALRDGPLDADDCLEVWLDPGSHRREAYHLIFSVAGGVCDARQWETTVLDPRALVEGSQGTTRHEDPDWDGHAGAAFVRAADRWSAEVRVPATDFGLPGIVEGGVWGLNVARRRWAVPGGEHSSLTGLGGWPMDGFAGVTLGLAPVEVSGLGLGGLGVGENELQFECRAPRRDVPGVDVRLTVRDAEERTVRFGVPLDADKPAVITRAYTLAACPAAVTLELLHPTSNEVLYQAAVSGDLSTPVRVYPLSEAAVLSRDPWWVDLDLQIGSASLARSRLLVEVLAPTGRVRQRQRVADLTPTMRLTFRPRAIGPAGDWTLRFIVLDGKQELGRAKVPLRLLRPNPQPPLTSRS